MKCLEKANLYKQQSDFLRLRMGVRLTVKRYETTFRMTEMWSNQPLGFVSEENVSWDVGLSVLIY